MSLFFNRNGICFANITRDGYGEHSSRMGGQLCMYCGTSNFSMQESIRVLSTRERRSMYVIETWKKETDRLHKIELSLKSQLAKSESEKQTLKSQLAKSESEKQAFHCQLHTSESEKQSMQSELETLASKNKELEETIALMKLKAKEMKSNLMHGSLCLDPIFY